MDRCDYPIDLRVDFADERSRGWAALTILLIKFFALIPHAFVLIFLTFAQLVVAFVAQVVVAITGVYPPGMFSFVTGVLRWSTRVSGFLFSLTDRYPPFTLQLDDAYPIEVVAQRPASCNRLYAAFTALVQVLFVAALVALGVWLLRNADGLASSLSTDGAPATASDWNSTLNLGTQSWGSGGLLLRQLAALPHYLVIMALGIVAFVIWLVVQWIILFTAAYPRGLFDLVAGIQRWQTRVSGYALGLSDRYPPFTFDPSVAAPATAPAQWYPDPTGRHQQRYWDGERWTLHVADGGRTSYESSVGPPAPTALE